MIEKIGVDSRARTANTQPAPPARPGPTPASRRIQSRRPPPRPPCSSPPKHRARRRHPPSPPACASSPALARRLCASHDSLQPAQPAPPVPRASQHQHPARPSQRRPLLATPAPLSLITSHRLVFALPQALLKTSCEACAPAPPGYACSKGHTQNAKPLGAPRVPCRVRAPHGTDDDVATARPAGWGAGGEQRATGEADGGAGL